jgi:murein DD-endopeptidase MepM/ murein hydrolase activator NlpD
MVKISPSIQPFPKLDTWLRTDFPKLAVDPFRAQVWNLFCQTTGLDPFTLLDAIDADAIRGPSLEIRELPHQAYGMFDPQQPDVIYLDQQLAEYFETNSTDVETQLIIEATVLHELVHWSEWRNGMDPSTGSNDRGLQFERAAYGRVMLRPDQPQASFAQRGFSDVMAPSAPPGEPAKEPAAIASIPFAILSADKHTWPVGTARADRTVSYRTVTGDSVGRPVRAFGADRPAGTSDNLNRVHVGVDLYAAEGDLIAASEAGVIVNHHNFLPPTQALLVQCDSGLVVNYGEIRDESWREFGLDIGSRISAGDAIARIGNTAMLHFEMYTRGTKVTSKWLKGGAAPANLLNPTKYLLALAVT